MEQNIALEIKSLTTGYDGRILAKGISAKLLAGQLTVMLGTNGVGKSTLMRVLAGFQKPLGGEVMIGGRVLSDYSASELSRKVSIVLTHRPELKDITVHELVGMGRSPYTNFWGCNSEDDDNIVSEALSAVGMESFAMRMVHSLSDGEFQKVMIAKALAQQTPVMLLDEPTAFLDFPSKVELMQMLRRIARERSVAVLVSSHDVELSLHTTDSLWVLSGEGISCGSPREISLNGGLDFLFKSSSIIFDRQTMSYRIVGK